ncbi:transposable element Tcb1 transposase [Trichonephila clavipes]|nr:transposable element Tcb1 transposase [Trichonephila clavipes]
MGAEFLFMEDNAHPRRANIVDECLQSEDITRMDWLAYSPDLNPVEQAWPYTILALNLAAVDTVDYLGGHAFRLTECWRMPIGGGGALVGVLERFCVLEEKKVNAALVLFVLRDF